MNYIWQMCMGEVTLLCSDCIIGHSAFNMGLLKSLPVLHR